jgi:hypothetical protein
MRIGLLALVVMVGCQPMYGKKAQKLKDPPAVASEGSAEGPPPKPYLDKCLTNMHVPSPPKGAPRDPVAAATYVQQAQKTIAKLDEPDARTETDKKRDQVLAAINQYHSALAKDPYDATATLELARLYDRTLRKGCALALLRRLEALAGHKSFEATANSAKQQVRDNTDWFADYRDEALAAIP